LREEKGLVHLAILCAVVGTLNSHANHLHFYT